jgi:hypothetical protein
MKKRGIDEAKIVKIGQKNDFVDRVYRDAIRRHWEQEQTMIQEKSQDRKKGVEKKKSQSPPRVSRTVVPFFQSDMGRMEKRPGDQAHLLDEKSEEGKKLLVHPEKKTTFNGSKSSENQVSQDILERV